MADHVSKVETSKRKLSSSSTGNHYKFNQQKPKKPKELSAEVTAREDYQDIKIINQLDGLSHCCPSGGDWGCCLKHFLLETTNIPDYERAVQYVRDNRIVSKEGSSHDTRDPMIISTFKNSISKETIRGQERIFEMDYRIPSPENLFGRDNTVKCCKKALWVVYGISEHEWKKTSSLFKECPRGQNVTTLHHKFYKDTTLHEYTHAEAAKVFEDNLGYTGGSFSCYDYVHNRIDLHMYTLLLDLSMVRNSLVPFAETQRLAVEWLKNYFDVYGDDSPNSADILVQIMLKGDLYQHYLKDMKGQPVVAETRFGELWNVLFPHCQRRSYCDQPGKCAVCYEIDKQRRATTDRNHAKMLKDAHLLHRGGMFMQEREWYV